MGIPVAHSPVSGKITVTRVDVKSLSTPVRSALATHITV